LLKGREIGFIAPTCEWTRAALRFVTGGDENGPCSNEFRFPRFALHNVAAKVGGKIARLYKQTKLPGSIRAPGGLWLAAGEESADC
jgi:hypothetical protein